MAPNQRLLRCFVQTAIIIVTGLATPAFAALALYGATEEADVVAKAPDRYEKIPPRSASSGAPIYIERTKPKMRIDDRDIEAIILEERRTAVSETGQKVEGEPYYVMTFVLRPPAAKALSGFLNKHEDQRFGLRFGKTTLGSIRVVGPFDGNEFTTYSHSKKPELERAFASVKDKLRWK